MSEPTEQDILIKYIVNLKEEYLAMVSHLREEMQANEAKAIQYEVMANRLEIDIPQLETQCMNVKLKKLDKV